MHRILPKFRGASRFRLGPSRVPTTVVLAACALLGGRAAETDSGDGKGATVDLLQMSLKDLGEIKVTTVSRKTESLSGAAAAIHVITQEEIRRSGVTLVPEALRRVPGLEVARPDSRQWAISSRGFNGVFANKLLVLMDGRTVYTPLFSGVFWEELDTVLEDLDRIEVIRGPGATLWGANAVNGVINIITKNSKETQGVLMSGGGGFEETGFGTVRYGGRLATNVHYRVYGKYSNHDDFTRTDGGSANDSWWTSQSGFRLDWDASALNAVTLQGDYYYDHLSARVVRSSLNPPGVFPTAIRSKVEGGNMLGRWTHEFSSASELSAQMYYDRTDRGFGIGRELRDTLDFDVQHRFEAGGRHEIVWGAGYRYSTDDITESPDFMAGDPRVGLQLFSAFAQDEIAIVPERLHLVLGSKLEHHDFTGFEVQPGARIAWMPDERHTFWASISRAVRTPSRAERGFRFYAEPPLTLPPFPLPVIIPGSGNPSLGSEELLAYEVGYRVQVNHRLTLDWAAFYNDYDRLWGVVAKPSELRDSPVPHLVIPVTIDNILTGETYGTELSATWQPLNLWRLRASYTFLRMNLHSQGPVRSLTEESFETGNPRHQVFLWSDVDVGRNLEWGLGLRFVDSLPGQRIPAYTELDARLAWKPRKNCELAIVGRDLLDSHHPEAAPLVLGARDVEVDRAVFGKVTVRY